MESQGRPFQLPQSWHPATNASQRSPRFEMLCRFPSSPCAIAFPPRGLSFTTFHASVPLAHRSLEMPAEFPRPICHRPRIFELAGNQAPRFRQYHDGFTLALVLTPFSDFFLATQYGLVPARSRRRLLGTSPPYRYAGRAPLSFNASPQGWQEHS